MLDVLSIIHLILFALGLQNNFIISTLKKIKFKIMLHLISNRTRNSNTVLSKTFLLWIPLKIKLLKNERLTCNQEILTANSILTSRRAILTYKKLNGSKGGFKISGILMQLNLLSLTVTHFYL